jgi:RNA polymerase sigma-70 factor (ECF subfamily)
MNAKLQGNIFGIIDCYSESGNKSKTVSLMTSVEDTTDEMLVDAIRSGSADSEELFIKRFRRGLVIMLQQRTYDKALAEDLTQETLVTVLTRLRKTGIDNPKMLRSFVQQTAKYMLIGWLRKSVNQMETRENFDASVAETSTIEAGEIVNERRKVVRELIDSLKVHRDREILFRNYVNDQTKEGICDALSLQETHFDRVISRARARFRELANHRLADLLEED